MLADQLLKEASQLSLPELDQLVPKVISLRAHRVAPGLPFREAELLQQINRGIPVGSRQRLRKLYEKRDSEQLNEHEHDEIKRLVLQVEQIQSRADRLFDGACGFARNDADGADGTIRAGWRGTFLTAFRPKSGKRSSRARLVAVSIAAARHVLPCNRFRLSTLNQKAQVDRTI